MDNIETTKTWAFIPQLKSRLFQYLCKKPTSNDQFLNEQFSVTCSFTRRISNLTEVKTTPGQWEGHGRDLRRRRALLSRECFSDRREQGRTRCCLRGHHLHGRARPCSLHCSHSPTLRPQRVLCQQGPCPYSCDAARGWEWHRLLWARL